MSESQKGLAIVWAVDQLVFTAGIVSAAGASASSQIQSLSVVRDGETFYIKNNLGETVGRVDYDGKKLMTINAIPSNATSKTIARTAAMGTDGWLPAKGTTIVISNSAGTFYEGNWVCNKSQMNQTNTGAVTIEVEMEKFDDNDITTTVT